MLNDAHIKFRKIESGRSVIGSPRDESKRNGNELQHTVIFSRPFLMQTTTVSVGLWRLFINETKYRTEAEKDGWAWCFIKTKRWKIPYLIPVFEWQQLPGYNWDNPGFYQKDSYPVTNISWNDVQEFIKWFNQKKSRLYRLPTEAEWEHACRSGTVTAYNVGNSIAKKNANFSIRFDSIGYVLRKKRTKAVGHYHPNKWGLYNMHGNVWEWCQDSCYMVDGGRLVSTDTYCDDILDPICDEGDHRVLRGGSWAYPANYCRSAFRRGLYPNERASGIGFRLASTIE